MKKLKKIKKLKKLKKFKQLKKMKKQKILKTALVERAFKLLASKRYVTSIPTKV